MTHVEPPCTKFVEGWSRDPEICAGCKRTRWTHDELAKSRAASRARTPAKLQDVFAQTTDEEATALHDVLAMAVEDGLCEEQPTRATLTLERVLERANAVWAALAGSEWKKKGAKQ